MTSGPEQSPEQSPSDEIEGRAIPDSEILDETARDRPEPVELVTCVRCGKQVPVSKPRCFHCDARLPIIHGSDRVSLNAATASEGSGIPSQGDVGLAFSRLLLFYLLMLATSLISGWITKHSIKVGMSDEEVHQISLWITCFFEAIDTVIVLIAAATLRHVPRLTYRSRNQKLLGWLSGPIILAILLALNVGYHSVLQSYVQFPDWALDRAEKWSVSLLIVFCLQPGIVEELFFRHLVQSTLTGAMGTHSAIWVTAIMFGMAHIFVPLSIPILTIVGAGFGYARVWSGSLVLPIMLHALHNAVVLWLERAS